MATIKSYTDLEQSKVLSKILPLESADMRYQMRYDNKNNLKYIPVFVSTIIPLRTDISCWSLAALLEQLPYELCDDDGNSLLLEINKDEDMYQLVYTDRYEYFESIETDIHEHFVDACFEMIIKLNELKML